MRVRRKLIKAKVDELIASSEINSAPVNVGGIAQDLHLEVIRQDADESVSGFLLKGIDDGGIIGVNRRHNLSRQRFTIAHEIGHFLLHDYEGVHFDGDSTTLQVYRRDANSSTGLDLNEREANLFAAELLMPESLLRDEMLKIEKLGLLDESDETIRKLATKYRVSSSAMTYRLINLGYISL